MNSRRKILVEGLYRAIDQLRDRCGGCRLLARCHGRMRWPRHGIYLFFEDGELRDNGETLRVTRVGTHALTAHSKTTLWDRLRTHRGTIGGSQPGTGNHRASIFRLHVGTALLARGHHPEAAATWGRGSSATRETRQREIALERTVSSYIRAMPLLWLDVPDRQDRAQLERSIIALLSNLHRPPIDPATPSWLGRSARSEAIRTSGLWNVQHVDIPPDPAPLHRFEHLVQPPRT